MSSSDGRPWIIVAGDFATHGGMDRANYEFAHFVANHRLGEVHLVAHRVGEPLASLPGVHVHSVSRPAGKHFFGGWFLSRAGRKLAHQLKAANPHVVVNGANCLWEGANWVHYVHRAFRPKNRGVPLLRRLKSSLDRFRNVRAEARAFAAAKLMIVNSKRTAQDIRAVVGDDRTDRIHLVYLGIDASAYPIAGEKERQEARRRLDIPDLTKAILFLGAIGFDQRKGLDSLLQAFQRLGAHRDRSCLYIVGGGRLDYWRRAIADDRIRLMGPRDDVADWLAAADLLVSPTRYEAYGMAVQESLCRGLPAIVSRSAGVAERYPNELSELLLPDPDDTDDLARRIKLVLDEPERFRPRVRALGDELRKWTWTDMAAEMVRLINAHT